MLCESYKKAREVIEKYNYKDIFNCDETGLLWKCPSGKTLILKNETKASGKIPKDRITLHLCCSLAGEKIKPLVIGKYKNPRGFREINFKNLDLEYAYSKRAWMIGDIFRIWI